MHAGSQKRELETLAVFVWVRRQREVQHVWYVCVIRLSAHPMRILVFDFSAHCTTKNVRCRKWVYAPKSNARNRPPGTKCTDIAIACI